MTRFQARTSECAASPICSRVVPRPSDSLTAPSAVEASSPIARSTPEGSSVPSWQAEPVEAATSGAAPSTAFPETPGNDTFSVQVTDIVRDGQYLVVRQVFYRLADPDVLAGYRALRQLAEQRLAEIDRLVRDYFGGVDGMQPVGRGELLELARGGEVVVLDVRPYEEYKAGHIRGALSIPLASLEKHLSEIPADHDVVACCRGPYCVLAAEAVKLLRRRGYRAFRLRDGYPEWRDGGLPVEAGESAASSQ